VIIKTIRNKKYEQLLSSTLVKKAIKNGEGIDGMVSQSVKEIIDLNGLYKSK
jgi:nicotinic acid mononucleotide adenylyltransferase